MHGAQSLLPNTVFSDVCSPLWCSHEANSQGRPAETLLMRDNLVLLGAAERANVSASCQNKNMAGFLLLLFFFSSLLSLSAQSCLSLARALWSHKIC